MGGHKFHLGRKRKCQQQAGGRKAGRPTKKRKTSDGISLTEIRRDICDLPSGWSLIESPPSMLVMNKSLYMESTASVVTKFSLIIEEDLSWKIALPHGISIRCGSPILEHVPAKLEDNATILGLLSTINAASTCQGNCDEKYHVLSESRDGKFFDHKSEL